MMHEFRHEVTNNLKTGNDFKEYDRFYYECKDDDIWVTTEVPLTDKL
jgi:hypothetical protein